MKLEELSSLDRKEVREVMEDYLGSDPAKFALKFRDSNLPTAALATQIDLLPKAAKKLPDWYNARCFFTRRGLEQASSQESLRVKNWGTGLRAIDLTGGLGVDVWHISKHFQRVDYVEPDPVLCQLARINFRQLGRENISIHASTAEVFIQSLPEEAAYDLIYLDPDRRNASGQRVAAFEDCQPNVLSLLPDLIRHLAPGGEVWIKASPMLDIAEGRRQLLLLAAGVRAEVISQDNEVKEVLFRIREKVGDKDAEVVCHIVRKDGLHRFQGLPKEEPGENSIQSENMEGAEKAEKEGLAEKDSKGQYLYEADVALYKAGLVQAYFHAIHGFSGEMNHPEGYFFSDLCLEELPARIFKVLAQWPYKPKMLKRELKNRGIEKMEVSRRYFDLSVKLVYQQLGVKPGGDQYLILTRSRNGERIALLCERIR